MATLRMPWWWLRHGAENYRRLCPIEDVAVRFGAVVAQPVVDFVFAMWRLGNAERISGHRNNKLATLIPKFG
jgi:hypothetical protein